MEPRDRTYIEIIVSYCDEIENAIDELNIDYDAFMSSLARRGVLAFFVEQIGEMAGKLSKEFRENHPEMDWPAIISFRHHIAHAYVGVIPDVLWDTVQNDVPELKNCLKALLK